MRIRVEKLIKHKCDTCTEDTAIKKLTLGDNEIYLCQDGIDMLRDQLKGDD